MAGISAVIGSKVLDYGSNILNTRLAEESQKRLLSDQYNQYLDYSHRAGATPAAIAAGITGSPSSTPSVSALPSSSSASDMSSVVGAMSRAKESETAAYNAETQRMETESNIRINEMNLFWKPRLFRNEINKTWSEIRKNDSDVFRNKSLAGYYDELRKTVLHSRPYQIARLSAGLQNDLATYNEIVARTNFNNSASRLNNEKSITESYVRDNLSSQTNLNYEFAHSEYLKQFGLEFDNSIRAAGFDPNKPAFENLKRLSMTDPEQFDLYCNKTITSLDKLDDNLKTVFGDHYKRNLGLIGAGYLGNKLWQQHFNNANTLLRTISGFVPFGSSSPMPSNSGMSVISPYYFMNY